MTSVSKNLNKYHSYAFKTPEIKIHDLNSFLLIFLIFHFEIHIPIETKDDPNDSFCQPFSVLAKALTHNHRLEVAKWWHSIQCWTSPNKQHPGER